MILSSEMDGEAKDLAMCMAGIAKEIVKHNRP